MKYCTNCGETISPDAKFCAHCGKAQSDVAAPSSKSIPSGPERTLCVGRPSIQWLAFVVLFLGMCWLIMVFGANKIFWPTIILGTPMIIAVLNFRSQSSEVTDRRVVSTSGFLSPKIVAIPLEQITNVTVKNALVRVSTGSFMD